MPYKVLYKHRFFMDYDPHYGRHRETIYILEEAPYIKIVDGITYYNDEEVKENIYIKNWHGRTHNSNGPAQILTNGTVSWWINGVKHRNDGPALIQPDGRLEWVHHGQSHRANGPAKIFPNGGEEWWFNGQLHREDGPAATSASGMRQWYYHGERHRDDGPCVLQTKTDLGPRYAVQLTFCVHGKDITNEVMHWLIDRDFKWPADFDDCRFEGDDLIEFRMRFL